MTDVEYAVYLVQAARGVLKELNAKVEFGTEIGRRLSGILVRAIDEVEELAKDANGLQNEV